jgi:hypothetical protein
MSIASLSTSELEKFWKQFNELPLVEQRGQSLCSKPVLKHSMHSSRRRAQTAGTV